MLMTAFVQKNRPHVCVWNNIFFYYNIIFILYSLEFGHRGRAYQPKSQILVLVNITFLQKRIIVDCQMLVFFFYFFLRWYF